MKFRISSQLLTIALALTTSSAGLVNVSFAQMITPDGKTNTTVTPNAAGNVHDVRTGTVQGNVAFNSFNNFDVYKNNTANLHLPQGTANLINIVRGKQSNIDGILNSIKDGNIGGNVFFLNPHGIIIGETGVVNVGSLTLATPTPEFIENAIAADKTVSSAFTQAVLAGDMPINTTGLISVKGKINTQNGAALKGGKVEITKTGEVNSGVGAKDLVNLGAADAPVEIKGGKIVIKSQTNIVHRGKIKSKGAVEIEAKEKAIVGREETKGRSSIMSSGGVDGGGLIEVTGLNQGISLFGTDIIITGGTFNETAVNGVVSVSALSNLTMSGDFVFGTDKYEFSALNTLTMEAGTTIRSASPKVGTGDLVFTGKNIVLKDGVIIDTRSFDGTVTGGNVSIIAENTWTNIGYDVNFDTVNATITLGDNVAIHGKNVTLKAIARDSSSLLDLAGSLVGNEDGEIDLPDENLQTGIEIWDLGQQVSGVYNDAKAEALITVGKNADLKAAETLEIMTEAVTEAKLTGSNILSFGVGVAKTDAVSKITLGEGGSYVGKDVDIRANSINTLELNVSVAESAFALMGSQAISFAYADMMGETSIDIAKNTNIKADNNVTIIANTEKTLEVSSTTTITNNKNFGIAILLSNDDVKNNVSINGSVTAGNTIDVQSTIKGQAASIIAESSVGQGLAGKIKAKFIGQDILNAVKGLLGNVFSSANPLAKFVSKGDIGASAAFARVSHNNAATLTLGELSSFTVTGANAQKANFYAGIEDRKFQHNVSAAVKPSGMPMDDRKKAGALAILIMEDNNTASLTAKDGATFEVDGELKFRSSYELVLEDPDFVKLVESLKNKNLDDAYDELNKLDQYKLISTWVSSKSESTNDPQDDGSGFGVSGSVNFSKYNKQVTTDLGAVKINQAAQAASALGEANAPGTHGNSNRSVVVEAESKAFNINLGGVYGLTLFGNKSDKGLGASYQQIAYNNEVIARIGDGASVYANKDLFVKAVNDYTTVAASVAFGKCETFGFDGAFNWLDVENKTIANIGQANILIQGANAGDGSYGYGVYANDTTRLVNITGGVTLAENIGVGASVSITDLERDTQAYVGKNKDTDTTTSSEFDTDSGFTVEAGNDGYLQAHSLAAAVSKESKDDESIEKKSAKGDGGDYGVGISGNVSLTNIGGGAAAYVNGMRYKGAGDLTLSASDETDIMTVAGAISLALQDKTSVGLAGAVSINEIGNTTQAFIKNTTLNISSGNVSLNAVNSGDIFAIAASGAGAKASDVSVSVAGSVTINEISNNTWAYIEGSLLNTSAGNISVNAKDEAEIFSIAGAISFAAGQKAAVGIGSSVGVNTINNSVYAYSKKANLTGDELSFGALNDADIFTVSATAGVTSGKGLAAAVSISVNEIENSTVAYIDNAVASTTTGDLSLTAANTADIFAIAGQFTLSLQGLAGGGSVAINTINNTTLTHITGNSNIGTAGSLYLNARNASSIETSSAGISVATGDVAVAGSVSVNNISTTTSSFISDSIVNTLGSAELSAVSANSIKFYGGMVAISKTVGAGGTAGVNNMSNKAFAYIDNSTVNVYGQTALSDGYKGLRIDSKVNDELELYSVNIAGSGTAAIAANANVSQINNSSKAYIAGNSKINQTVGAYDPGQSISLNADNTIDISSYGGSGAASGHAAIGAAADVTLVQNETFAYIDGSMVRSPKDISITTHSSGRYNLVMAAGAVAIEGAGIAGNVAVVDFAGKNSAYIKGSDVYSLGNLTIDAEDSVVLGDSELVLGTVGIGAIGAGIGGTVWVSTISNATNAYIHGSEVDSEKTLTLNANGTYEIKPYIATVGASGVGAGIALTASVNTVKTSVQSFIENGSSQNTRINRRTTSSEQNVSINASNEVTIETLMASAGGAGLGAGIGAAVAVNTIDTTASAGIKSGVELQAGGKLDISASNERTIEDIVIAAGIGAVGVSGSISINNIGSNLDADGKEALTKSDGGNDSTIGVINSQLSTRNEVNSNTLGHGDLFAGSNMDMDRFNYDVNDLLSTQDKQTSTTAYIASDAKVTTGGDINVTATDTVNLDLNVGGVALGAVGVGATVAVTNVTTNTNAYIGNGANVQAGGKLNIVSNANIPQGDILATIGAGSISFSAGAVVAVLNSHSTNTAYIGNNATVKASDLLVEASSTADLNVQTVGASVGAVAIGASVATVERSGETKASVGQGSNITANNATVTAETDYDVNVMAAAGAGGVVSGSAAVATANVSNELLSIIQQSSRLNIANDLEISTHGSADVMAETVGVNVGIYSAGASVAIAELSLTNKAVINDGAVINAGEIILNAEETSSSKAKAVGVSGGVIAGSGASASASADGKVQSIIGNSAKLTGKTGIGSTAQSNVTLDASADRYSVGAISGGLNHAATKASINTHSITCVGIEVNSPLFELHARMTLDANAHTVSGSGGLVDVSGVIAKNINDSNTIIKLGDKTTDPETVINAGRFLAYANNDVNQDVKVDGTQAGGITASGYYAETGSTQNLLVNMGGNVKLNANHIDINANNAFTKNNYAYSIDYLGISGLSVPIATSQTTLQGNTEVVFGDGLVVNVTNDSEEKNSFVVKTYNDLMINDKVKLEAGAALASPVLKSNVDVTTNANTKVGQAKIKSVGDINFNGKTDSTILSTTNMSVYGAASLVKGATNVNAVSYNNITLNNGAEVYALGDVLFYLGLPLGDDRARMTVEAVTQMWNKTAIAMSSGSTAYGRHDVNNWINILGGSKLKSAQNIHMESKDAIVRAIGIFDYVSPMGEIAATNKTGSADVVHLSTVSAHGDVLAGVNSIQNITINSDGTVTVSNKESDVRWTLSQEKVGSGLIARKDELVKLRAKYIKDDVLRNQYDFEIRVIEQQMAELGITETQGGQTMDSEVNVDYIAFQNLYANKGDIYVYADNFVGTGTLSAEGYAEIKIINNSNKFLRLNDVIIKDNADGHIYFNTALVKTAEDISEMNKGGASGFSNSKINTADDSTKPSSIIIRNNYVKDNVAGVLELIGTVENRKGEVDIFSEGSIYAVGNIRAGNLVIQSNKDIVQTYNEGITHVGGLPSYVWSTIASNAENSASTDIKNNTTPTGKSQSSITAQNIYLGARYLNLNGLIQAGVADLTLNINSNDIQLDGYAAQSWLGLSSIDVARRDYNAKLNQGNTGASPLYKLVKGSNTVTSYYNVLTNEIVVDNISAGGGTVELYGHILNTAVSGEGKIVALDGYSRLNIDNKSKYNLILNNIDLSEAEGQVRITDTSKPLVGGKAYQVLYTRNFNGSNSYVNVYDNRTADAQGNPTYLVSSSQTNKTQYNPTANQRYTWMTGQTSTDKEKWYAMDETFWGFDVGHEMKYDKTIEKGVPQFLPQGELIFNDSSGYNYVYGSNTYTLSFEQTYERKWTTSTGWWIFGTKRYHHEVHYETGKMTYHKHSIKASNPVSIEFIGYDSGYANIQSNSNITLKGDINNHSGVVDMTSRNDAIINAGPGSIAAKGINLTANTGIGSNLSIVIDLKDGGVVNANTATGNIDLFGQFSDVTIGQIAAKKGDVSISSNYGIKAYNTASLIETNNLYLETKLGSIGATDKLIRTQVKEVNALAGDSVYITQVSGDLGVNSIIAGNYVEVNNLNGSIYDANLNDQADLRNMEILAQAWDDMNLFDTDGASWTVDQLKYAVNANKISDGTSTTLKIEEPNIKADKVKVTATGSIGMDDGSITLDLKNYAGISLEDKALLAAAEADALEFTFEGDVPVSVLIKKIEDFDIESKDISLNANGYIYLGGETDININQIQAGADQNITIKGAQGIYSVATAPVVNIKGGNVLLEAGKKGIGSLQKPLSLEATGKLDARAQEGIYITSPIDIKVSYIYSGEEVSLSSLGNIVNFLDDSDLINIWAKGIDLSAKNIGASDKAFVVQVDQEMDEDEIVDPKKTLSLDVSNNAYIKNVNSDLYVGDIEVDNHLTLTAEKNILQGSDTAVIAAKTANLISLNESLGTSDTKLVTEVGSLTASAKKDVNLYLGLSENTNLNTVSAETGTISIAGVSIIDVLKTLTAGKDIILSAPDTIKLAGNVTAGEKVTVTGGSIESLAKIKAKKAVTLSGDDIELNNVTSEQETISITATGDVVTEGALSSKKVMAITAGGEVTLNGTTTSGEDIAIESGDLTVNGKLTAANNLDVTASSMTTTAEVAATAGNATISTTGDTTLGANLTAGKDISLDAADLKSTADITAGDNVTVNATNQKSKNIAATNGELVLNLVNSLVSQGAMTSGKDMAITAGGDVTLKGTTTSGEDIAIESGDLTVNGKLTAANNLDVSASSMTTTAEIAATAGNATIATTGDTTLGANLTAGKDISLDAADLKSTADITAGDNVTVNATNQESKNIAATNGELVLNLVNSLVSQGAMTSGKDMAITAGGEVTLNGTTTSGEDIAIESGDLTVNGKLTAANNLDVSASSMTTTAEVAATTGNATISTTGDTTLGASLTAGKDVNITAESLLANAKIEAKSGDATIHATESAKLNDDLVAGNDVSVNAEDITSIANIIAGRNVTVDGGKMVSNNVTAGTGDVSISLDNSLVSQGKIQSGQNTDITATREVTLNGNVNAGNSVAINTAILNINAMVDALQNIGLTVGDVTTKAGTHLKTQNGNIIADVTGNAAFAGDIDAGDSVSITGGNIASTASISAVNGVTIKANSLVGNNIKTTLGDIITQTKGDTTFNGEILGGRDILVTSGGDLLLNGIMTAGRDIFLNNKKITLNGNVVAQGNIIVDAKDDFFMNAELSSLNKDVVLRTVNNVLLNGVMSANKGLVSINARGTINDALPDTQASIKANDIDLKALSIGQANNYLGVNTSMTNQGYLSAASRFDLYITSPGKGLDIKKLEVTEGNINLVGKSSMNFYQVTGADYNLKANNIILHATEGVIGAMNAPGSTALNSSYGNINLLANDGIYLRHTTHSFYSDYVYNMGGGEIALWLLDNNIQIKDIIGAKGAIISPLQYHSINKDSQVTIGYHNVQKLVVDPEPTRLRLINHIMEEAEEIEEDLKGDILKYDPHNIFNSQVSL